MMKERFAQRMREQQQRGEKGGGNLFKQGIKDLQFFKCGEKKHTIDIIPYFAGKNDPNVKEGEEAYVFEFFIHRDCGVGEGAIMCLAETYGKPCPICEDRRRKLRDGGDEKKLDKLRPARNPRSVYNIICYDDKAEEEKGVQVFHTSHYLMEAQLQELASGTPVRPGQEELEPLVLFMDPNEGKSIVFTRVGQQDKTRYTGVKFVDRPKGYEKIDPRDLDDAWALDEIVYVPTYEEVCEFYYGKGQPAGGGERAAGGGEAAGEERGGRRGRYAAEGVEQPATDTSAGAGEQAAEDRGGRRSRRSGGESDAGSTAGSAAAGSTAGGAGAAGTSNPCPHGHVFGVDIDKFQSDCEPCEQWKVCARKNKELSAGGGGTAGASAGTDAGAGAGGDAGAGEGRRSRRSEASADPGQTSQSAADSGSGVQSSDLPPRRRRA
jgi:hypothetical protein